MDAQSFWFPAYYVLLMFTAAYNARFLGVCIVAGLALLAVYPNTMAGGMVVLFLVPAILIAGFRE